jgi:ATP-dependent HslUV protease ATP-binding subunit HslU
MLRAGKLDERHVEVDVAEQHNPAVQIFSQTGLEEMGLNLRELFGKGASKSRRRVSVAEALALLETEEAQKLIDMDKVVKEAIHRAENSGIIFIDEIDKVAGKENAAGPDVSRQGVQRDLLPIVEGSTVTTKFGPVRTDHVLFIAAGAFHMSKPSDLIPELQGRFPIRVELEPLGAADFVRILTEPENSLTRQYQALLATEAVALEFTPEGVRRLAEIAWQVNERTENIGARRLHTVMEKLLEDVSYSAGSRATGSSAPAPVVIDAAFVDERLAGLAASDDLARYVL